MLAEEQVGIYFVPYSEGRRGQRLVLDSSDPVTAAATNYPDYTP
jgi:hypothetical protein